MKIQTRCTWSVVLPVHPPARTLTPTAPDSVWQVASVLMALCWMSPLTDVWLSRNVLVSAKSRMPIMHIYIYLGLAGFQGPGIVWNGKKSRGVYYEIEIDAS